MGINKKMLELLPDNGFLYKLFLKKVVKNEGGQKTSQTLRKRSKELHNVNIGMHTYGSCFDEGFSSGKQVNIGRYCSFRIFIIKNFRDLKLMM